MKERILCVPLIASLLAFGAVLTGCAPASVRMANAYTAPDYYATHHSDTPLPPPPPQTCSVYVQDIKDMRLADERTFGNIGGAPIYGSNMVDWMKTGLATLDEKGFRMDQPAAAPVTPLQDNVTIQVGVLKAYMESVTTTKVATVVVRVSYNDADLNTPVTRIYRGVDTSLNWADGTGEVESAFERATAQILGKVQTDLRNYCPASPRKQQAGITVSR
jgi:hypothetical protein